MNDKFPDLHAQAVTLISKEMGMDEKSIHKALRRYEYGASNLSAYSRQLVAHVQCLTKLLLTEKALARRDGGLQEARELIRKLQGITANPRARDAEEISPLCQRKPNDRYGKI